MLLCFCFYCNASAQVVNTTPQTSTTGDLLDPSAQNWTGTYGTGWWGGSRNPAGVGNESVPNRLPTDSGFIWGGKDQIISTTIAINTALAQAGIQVNGFTYKWRVKNGNANIYQNQPGIDDFEITVEILDSNGNTYQTYVYDYGHSHNWTTHQGSETFPNQFLPPSYFSDINILAQGSDSANWAGRYGPEFNVAQSELKLTFSANPCHNDPLYDPQCQGYAVALFNQQCTQNPLFDPTCTGYAAAYMTQQCSANPLHDPTCPGYSTAYYNQQCSLNALHDQNCPGYATAYLNQQCALNPLHDTSCTGYATAYFNQQCSISALHDQNCPGYATAYFNQQCSISALHDPQCPGYATAYFNQQCSISALYNAQCPGYATAYYNQQCSLNPLYDTQCPGYATAYYNQQCTLDPLYDAGCTGYAQAYYNQQCSLDPLYDKGCPGHATAYLNQQCALDPLFDATCTGYKEAKCNIDPLYETTCIGYDVAYFNQQCSFDPQYDETCAGYISPIQIVDDGTDIDPIEEILDTEIIIGDINTGLQIEGLPTVQNFVQPTVDTTTETVQIPEVDIVQSDLTAMEDSIERELAELESMDGTMAMSDNIEAEIASLESQSNNGQSNQEDNIEAEIASLEEETNNPNADEAKEELEEVKEESEEIEEKEEEKKEDKQKSKEDNKTPGEKDGSIGGSKEQEDDIEKEIAQLKEETKEEPKAKKKPTSRNDKLKMLIAKKANELTKKIENAVTIEQQMLVQRQLLALISFVPGFDYNKKEIEQIAFYPDKPTVDHYFSRWFLNDPKFGAMEELQYNLK